jgi:hypothetical protein
MWFVRKRDDGDGQWEVGCWGPDEDGQIVWCIESVHATRAEAWRHCKRLMRYGTLGPRRYSRGMCRRVKRELARTN